MNKFRKMGNINFIRPVDSEVPQKSKGEKSSCNSNGFSQLPASLQYHVIEINDDEDDDGDELNHINDNSDSNDETDNDIHVNVDLTDIKTQIEKLMSIAHKQLNAEFVCLLYDDSSQTVSSFGTPAGIDFVEAQSGLCFQFKKHVHLISSGDYFLQDDDAADKENVVCIGSDHEELDDRYSMCRTSELQRGKQHCSFQTAYTNAIDQQCNNTSSAMNDSSQSSTVCKDNEVDDSRQPNSSCGSSEKCSQRASDTASGDQQNTEFHGDFGGNSDQHFVDGDNGKQSSQLECGTGEQNVDGINTDQQQCVNNDNDQQDNISSTNNGHVNNDIVTAVNEQQWNVININELHNITIDSVINGIDTGNAIQGDTTTTINGTTNYSVLMDTLNAADIQTLSLIANSASDSNFATFQTICDSAVNQLELTSAADGGPSNNFTELTPVVINYDYDSVQFDNSNIPSGPTVDANLIADPTSDGLIDLNSATTNHQAELTVINPSQEETKQMLDRRKRRAANGERNLAKDMGQGQFICEYCSRAFTKKAQLDKHTRIHTNERPFGCDRCGKTFMRRDHLREHSHTHKKDKPYQCDCCNRTFAQKVTLQIHYRTHTGAKPFSCQYCGREFAHRYPWRRHVQRHTAMPPFVCQICQAEFDAPSELSKHVKISHTKPDPRLACTYCGRQFTLKATLVEHVRLHTGEQPFICQICAKMFSHKSSLVNHMRRHDIELEEGDDSGLGIRKPIVSAPKPRPYQCPICPKKTFANQFGLDRHVRTHSGMRPYKCDKCGKTFTDPSVLRRHSKSC